MAIRTLLVATCWIGVVLVGWSVNLRWGDDPSYGGGPPSQWERQVIGAALLAAIAALTMTLSTRGGRAPGPLALATAPLAALGAVGLALYLRRDADASGFPHLVQGPGWLWLTVGAVTVFAAVCTGLILGRRGASKRCDSRRPRHRR